jgi:hypothetical protein
VTPRDEDQGACLTEEAICVLDVVGVSPDDADICVATACRLTESGHPLRDGSEG